MLHPSSGQDVYFLLDPSHAFRCIRNNTYTKMIVQVNFNIFLLNLLL